ncbi:hypothetical protein K1719_012928 [Acacia pycnantha]|nr:hypothetical protein K1719_012928 [Acacia pycnantha]
MNEKNLTWEMESGTKESGGEKEGGGVSDGGKSGSKEGDGGGGLHEGVIPSTKFDTRMQGSMVSDTGMRTYLDSMEVSRIGTSSLTRERSVYGSKIVEEVKISNEDFRIDCSGEVPSIDFSKEVRDVLAKGMEKTLIIKLLGRSITYPTLLARTQALWRLRGCFRLVDMVGGFYMATFDLEEDYTKVLTGGPWMLFGAYLVVQPWTLNFDPSLSVMSKVVVWVRIPGLSFRYYHKTALKAIGTLLGEVIRVDPMTENRGRGRYARIAVLMDLLKPLVPWIKVDGKLHGIEYEGLPQICFTCGRYGHTTGTCKGEAVQNQEALREKVPSSKEDSGNLCTTNSSTRVVGGDQREAVPTYGEWMQVRYPKKGNKRNSVKQAKIGEAAINGGSRFNVLFESADLVEQNQHMPVLRIWRVLRAVAKLKGSHAANVEGKTKEVGSFQRLQRQNGPKYKPIKPIQEYRRKEAASSPLPIGELPKASSTENTSLDIVSNAPANCVIKESVPIQDGPEIEIVNNPALWIRQWLW